MDDSMIRIICTVLAILFAGLIVLCKKKGPESDISSPDLIVYALIAAFVAVAAGAIAPSIVDNIEVVFSKIATVIDEASK